LESVKKSCFDESSVSVVPAQRFQSPTICLCCWMRSHLGRIRAISQPFRFGGANVPRCSSHGVILAARSSPRAHPIPLGAQLGQMASMFGAGFRESSGGMEMRARYVGGEHPRRKRHCGRAGWRFTRQSPRSRLLSRVAMLSWRADRLSSASIPPCVGFTSPSS
jgi:hypothetical protein